MKLMLSCALVAALVPGFEQPGPRQEGAFFRSQVLPKLRTAKWREVPLGPEKRLYLVDFIQTYGNNPDENGPEWHKVAVSWANPVKLTKWERNFLATFREAVGASRKFSEEGAKNPVPYEEGFTRETPCAPDGFGEAWISNSEWRVSIRRSPGGQFYVYALIMGSH